MRKDKSVLWGTAIVLVSILLVLVQFLKQQELNQSEERQEIELKPNLSTAVSKHTLAAAKKSHHTDGIEMYSTAIPELDFETIKKRQLAVQPLLEIASRPLPSVAQQDKPQSSYRIDADGIKQAVSDFMHEI